MTTVVISADAFGHARLRTPVPRTNDDALKDGNGGAPCGGKARTGTPARYTEGQTITVQWEETINHAGCFIIKLSQANDQNFQMLANPPHSTTGGVPRQYSAQVKLPEGVTCSACTLQLIQVMNNTVPCPVVNIPAGDSYYSCADVEIVAAPPPDAGTTTPTDAGSVTPTDAGSVETDAGLEEPPDAGEVADAGGGAGGGTNRTKDGLEGGGFAEGGCSTAGGLSLLALLAILRALSPRRTR